MLSFIPEHNDINYTYISTYLCNDNTPLSTCIKHIGTINYYVKKSALRYIIKQELIQNDINEYLINVIREFDDFKIEFINNEKIIVKINDFQSYCYITWILEDDKYIFSVIYANNYSNDENGIYIYDYDSDNEDSKTEKHDDD